MLAISVRGTPNKYQMYINDVNTTEQKKSHILKQLKVSFFNIFCEFA